METVDIFREKKHFCNFFIIFFMQYTEIYYNTKEILD